MTDFSVERHEGVSLEPIAIDGEGNAFMDFTREKEAIIRSEGLNPQHLLVQIDLETILTGADGCGVSIVVQDFGLPPRVINIFGAFTNMNDVRGLSREESHYSSAPKYLTLTAKSLDTGKTYSLDEKGYPCDYEQVELGRGEAMLFVHEGPSSDERTGYIEGGTYDLIAVRPNDYYGAKDFTDIGIRYDRGYVPHIGLSYAGSILSIYSIDDAHAEVQYLQSRSLADEMAATLEVITDTIDADELITDLVAGSQEAKILFKDLLERRKTSAETIESLEEALRNARLGNDSLETVLAGVKRKLRDARYEATRLSGEVRQLRQQAQAAGGIPTRPEAGGKQTTKNDPHGHIAGLGLDPDFLFTLNPEAAMKVVKGMRGGFALQFHSDKKVGDTDDEPMKRVNIAIASIIERLENGIWGRF